jgi:hypothetical protein
MYQDFTFCLMDVRLKSYRDRKPWMQLVWNDFFRLFSQRFFKRLLEVFQASFRQKEGFQRLDFKLISTHGKADIVILLYVGSQWRSHSEVKLAREVLFVYGVGKIKADYGSEGNRAKVFFKHNSILLDFIKYRRDFDSLIAIKCIWIPFNIVIKGINFHCKGIKCKLRLQVFVIEELLNQTYNGDSG